jgi:hypothetical protein
MSKRVLGLVVAIPLLALLAVALALRPARAEGSERGEGRPFPTAPLPLEAFPRPPGDNGLGVHWSTHLFSQPDATTDYFVAELKAMNIKWVKFLNDDTVGFHYDYLVDHLVANGIMPVIRLYKRCNTPYDLASLDSYVRHYVARGVYYYETYNEPNVSGVDGGWCEPDGQPDPEYLARIWVPAAQAIYKAGGYPSLPSLFPSSKVHPGWENDFFHRFLRAVKDQGNSSTLYYSWGALHNYFINHPPDYPYDEVNLTSRLLTTQEIAKYKLSPQQVQKINEARIHAREPGGYFLGDNVGDDSTCFLMFLAYRDQFYDLFGFEIPLIGTEGGATVGSAEDPRYPRVDEQTVAERTLYSYEYMLDKAPPYYFATTTWLLAQAALDFPDPTWEVNAWYHDRQGDHQPVVEALKQFPRKGEARHDLPARWLYGQPPYPTYSPPTKLYFSPPANPLSLYPRPPDDNGRGIHWAPTIQAQSRETVDYFVDELKAMNIKWVKIMQGDTANLEHGYLIGRLANAGIEPVLRVYKPYNDPYEHLAELATTAVISGVHYVELYNEPNVKGTAGGWREGESISVERMLDLWIPAAVEVRRAGGHPGLPPLAGGGDYDDLRFLADFLDGLKARGRDDLLIGAWIPLHNYSLNHPLDYPGDPVNLYSVPLTAAEIARRGLTPEEVQAIVHARAISRLPRSQGGYYVGDTIYQDSNAFRKFEAYARIVFDRFGYYIPIISTEGGAVAGAHEDPRYPAVTDEDVTDLTLAAYRAMLANVPGYYFAFTPWLLANKAGEHGDPAWESAAWYKDRQGNTLPVVKALKKDPTRRQVRPWTEPPLPVRLAPASRDN